MPGAIIVPCLVLVNVVRNAISHELVFRNRTLTHSDYHSSHLSRHCLLLTYVYPNNFEQEKYVQEKNGVNKFVQPFWLNSFYSG